LPNESCQGDSTQSRPGAQNRRVNLKVGDPSCLTKQKQHAFSSLTNLWKSSRILKADIAKHFKPVDNLEAELVHEMAASRWCLRRIEKMDAALFQKFMRPQQEALGAEGDPSQSRSAIAGGAPGSTDHITQSLRASVP
jgi:hypothetical protein